MENLITGNPTPVQNSEIYHLNSLRSLCELLMREVNFLTSITPKIESPLEENKAISLSKEVERFEISLIKSALLQSGGRQSKAAKMLGVKITTLNTKIKRYGINSVD